MSEARQSEIIEIDEEQEEIIDPKDQLRDEIFEKLKLSFIEEVRLLKRFYDFCEEYANFEYDESAFNMDEADAVLNRANKIRDKIINSVSEQSSYTFENPQTITDTNIMTFFLNIEEYRFKIIVEVSEDSFDLEVI